jgi:hypothetical protein
MGPRPRSPRLSGPVSAPPRLCPRVPCCPHAAAVPSHHALPVKSRPAPRLPLLPRPRRSLPNNCVCIARLYAPTRVCVVTPVNRTAFIAHPPAAPVSLPLRRFPPAARSGPIKPLSLHELTPSASSLAHLPAAASERPQPPHSSSSQPLLFTCPRPLARLPPTPTITSHRCFASKEE